MNLIPEICKLLGVGVREEFKLKFDKNTVYDQTFRFDENRGLEYKDEYGWVQSCKTTAVLTGELEIVKLPFKPKAGERFFFISTLEPISVRQAYWSRSNRNTSELALLFCGNVFRTEEEAEKHKSEICEKLIGKSLEAEVELP